MKIIKKMYRFSLFYFVIGLATGLFHHEVEYWTNFTGTSILKYVHPHAIILGGLMFFILPLFVKVFSVHKTKYFKWFFIVYNSGLIGSLFFMGFRGIVQLYELPISSFLDHMVGGLASISHVILTVGLFFLYKALQSSNKEID